ncbi:MAG: hypothetical protein K8T20_04955 [Planctomycetes bacterium]|nr:hypothetical protein [Planctomycetota bacterium]
MKNFSLSLAVLTLLAAAASTARADDWDKIGSRVVAFGGDHDTIDGTGDGRFTAIKIDVDEGNLEMYDVKVTFGNGDPFSPDTRMQFDENTRSRTIDLPGEARAIRKIEFWYRSKGRKGRATVTVFGKRAGGGGGGAEEPRPPVARPPADDNKGWELLGMRIADFGGDHDTIEVTASEGRFKQIKIDVESGNVDMFDVKVTFGDGETFSPATRFEFKEGSMSRTIDLPGDARVIRKVEFSYKSEIRKGKARVRLYGNQAGGGGGGNDAKEKWEKLGTRIVDFVADKDTIEVGANEGRFDKIRIDVEDGNLDMWNIRVVFGDGQDFSPETKVEFRQGSMSRTIDLPGDTRVIRKIEFWYKSEFKKGRATVHVFGRQAAGGGGADVKPPQKDPKDRFPGWDHLGSRVVDFGGDHDAIDCKGEGRFTAFQVEVENGDLEMFDIVVTFGNGDKESVKTRFSFDDNSRTRTIDLPGNKRFIRRIDFYYKSVRVTRDGKATINLYGKR